MRRTFCLSIVCALSSGCGLPSDVSDEFAVVMTDDVLIMTVGDTAGLGAYVTRGDQAAPTIPIVYSSSDPTIAGVSQDGLLLGISVGQAEITARALGIETETTATRTVRVLRSVAIESVRPTMTDTPDGRTVQWGELVEITGVGLDPSGLNLIFVADRPAPIHSFVPAPIDDETASDTLRIWIPARVPEQASILLSRRGGSIAAWPLTIVQADVLEPNDVDRRTLAVPAEGIDIRGMALEVRPWLAGQTRCFSDFGGAAVQPGNCWTDGFSVDAATRDFTVVVSLPDQTFETAPISVEFGSPGSLYWSIQQTYSICADFSGTGAQFTVIDHYFDSSADSLILPFRDVDGPFRFDLTLFGEETSIAPAPTGEPETVAYDLRIWPDYRSALPPDASEGNDHCHQAAALPWPTGTLDLTWDHGRDIDWFRFTVPGTPPVTTPAVTVTESEPNDSFTPPDTLVYGDRAAGVIASAGDVDYYAFNATAGDWIDIDVRADRTEVSTLNAVLQLYDNGQQIAFSDDISITTFDPRITVQAPATGTYVFGIQSLSGVGGANATYEVDLRRLTSESSRVTVTATQTGGGSSAEVRPWVMLIQDDRANDGEVQLLAEFEDVATSILTPGDYFVLTYNKAGRPSEYRLQLAGVPIG